jgi:hypothetical protein
MYRIKGIKQEEKFIYEIKLIYFLILFVIRTSIAQFEEQKEIVLPGVESSSVAWGDYNNDGFLDILLTGNGDSCSVSEIFKNNGNRTFSKLTNTNLIGVNVGCAIWSDYNNDGFLDIILTGNTDSSDFVSKIYQNYSNGTFTELKEIQIHGLACGSIARGDYNNDTYSDILFTGSSTASISCRSALFLSGLI